MRLPLALAAVFALASAQSLSAAPDPAEFRSQLAGFVHELSRSPGAPPGFAVVAVTRDAVLYETARGVRDAGRGSPMTLDTPIYNASTTKAYTGLLAAVLDRKGALPLQARLADVWAKAQLTPTAGAVNVAQLLSHSSGLAEGGLIFKSVYTGQAHAADVPVHLGRHLRQEPPAFRYSNFGPFTYSAMAETRTGLAWRDLMAREVFGPLGLTRSSARLEDFPVDEVARCHSRRGAGAWTPMELKPTPVLNAAGGIYASGRDTGRFLQAFLGAASPIPAETFRQTWRRQAEQSATFFGLQRDGYGLGWDLGAYQGHRYVSRSGGYVGCRSIALFMPELGFGVAVLSVGDTGANTFNVALVQQAIDLWLEDPGTPARAQDRMTQVTKAAEAIRAADERWRTALAEVVPGTPAPGYEGRYRHPRLGDLSVGRAERALTLRAGVFTADLLPLGERRFLLVSPAFEAPQPVRFDLAADGRAIALQWDDDTFERIAG